jgi:phosphoribosylaminoimidazolecarboxamide formyltransferase/IMP cyclohydrolase
MAARVADVFTEVLIAPGFEEAALEILTAKKNLRLLRCPAPGPERVGPEPAGAERVGPERVGPEPAGAERVGPASAGLESAGRMAEWRQLDGGLLMQTPDRFDAPGDDPAAWAHQAGPEAGSDVLADLAFAWRACRAAKSNAIVIASGGATVGVGMGQVNRVDSARIAVARSGERTKGAVAASDAYFPFADGLQVLADAGVRAIVEPGGSIRDGEVIAAAQAAGISLYFTGARHFFH